MLPCIGKVPARKDWIERRFSAEDFEADHNIGIKTGRVWALDLDCPSTALVEAILERVPTALVRRRGDRALVLMRAPDPSARKRTWVLEEGRIELLAAGQQFIAYGTHPSGERYRWVAGRGPADVAVEDLPEPADIEEVVIAALEVAGLRLKHEARSGAIVRRPEPRKFAAPPGSDPLLVEALEWLDADPYESWIAVGHHLRAIGADPALYDAWSATSTKYRAGECIARWEGFRVEPGTRPMHALVAAAGMSTAALDFSRAGVRTLADIAQQPPPEWLVKGLIPRRGLLSIVAAPNAGKSFLLLDLMRAIEAGEPWFGRRTKAAPQAICVLFSYEGSAVLRARALQARYPGAGRRIVVEDGWPRLTEEGEAARVIAHVRRIQRAMDGAPVAMVAFDTLNLALGGANENDAEAMGAAVGALKRLRDELNTCVAVVHHLGKDPTRGARGHSSLLGAVDTELTVVADQGTAIREISATKVRDGDRVGPFAWFRLRREDLGLDEDLDPITSCTVEAVRQEEAEGAAQDDVQRRILQALKAADGGLGKRALRETVGGKKDRLEAALQALLADGTIETVQGEHRTVLHRIKK